MKLTLIIAGAVALACAPAYAKPQASHDTQQYNVGERLPCGYKGYTAYRRIPHDLRNRYALDDDYRYIYRDDYLYQIDRKTLIVQRVLQPLLR